MIKEDFLKAEQAEGEMGSCSHLTEYVSDVSFFEPAKETNNKVSQRCHYLRGIFGSDLRPILIKSYITDIMEAIFNTPVPSIQLEQLFRSDLLWGKAGYSIDDFHCFFVGFKIGNFSTDTECLSDVWEFKVGV